MIDRGAYINATFQKDFFKSYVAGDFGVARWEMMVSLKLLAYEIYVWRSTMAQNRSEGCETCP